MVRILAYVNMSFFSRTIQTGHVTRPAPVLLAWKWILTFQVVRRPEWEDSHNSHRLERRRRASGGTIPHWLNPIGLCGKMLTEFDRLGIYATSGLTWRECCNLYIYSTNIGTEYFKHGIYSPFFFPLQNAVCFIILTYLVPVLFTFYIFIQQI